MQSVHLQVIVKFIDKKPISFCIPVESTNVDKFVPQNIQF